MPAQVETTSNGNYAVTHAVASGDVEVGDIFFESSGFGPLVFTTEGQANAVAGALNMELEERARREMMEVDANELAQRMMDSMNDRMNGGS